MINKSVSMSMLIKAIKERITVPEYYKQFMDESIDLDVEKNIPCKIHGGHDNEFTYSPAKGIWMCWGKCHTGGDVINLHKLNFKLKSREDAAISLGNILKIDMSKVDFEPPEQVLDEGQVEYLDYYNRAISLAKNVDDYLELDYIMSQNKFRNEMIEDLADFVVARE